MIALSGEAGWKEVPIRATDATRRSVSVWWPKAVHSLGDLDVVVSNAGRQQQCPSVLDLTTEAFDDTMKTNI